MKKILVFLLISTLFFAFSPLVHGTETTIQWTEEEQAYLESHPILTLGVDPQFIPYEFFDNGVYQGITADYIALMETRMGIDFQVTLNLSWTDALFRVMNGTLDLAPAILKTADREEVMLFSNLYYEVKRVMVTTVDTTDVETMADLEGSFVAVQEGSSHHSFLLTEYPGINISPYSTVGDGLSAVSTGEEKAFIGNLATSDYIAKSLGLTNLRFTVVPTDEPIGLHFATSLGEGTPAELAEAQLLIGIINKALASITREEKAEIQNRWVTVDIGTDYGPIIRVIIIIGSVILFVTGISIFWIFRLKKEIVSRKKIQADLEKAKRDAEEANSVKSSFMARMSHEIRTPLNAITGMAYLLKKTNISLTQKMYADRITQASTTMLSLINDILDYSKIEAGKVELEIVPFNLDSVIQNVISIVSVKIEEKGLGFKLSKDPEVPSWFQGDPKRIEQVLLNLLNNAVKFTAKGEISLDFRLTAKQGNKYHLTFTVRDTGIGMSEAVLKTLFVPFVQADSSINRRFGGTGLGLSIVKNLIELMGGTINVFSAEGEGSTFVVNLQLVFDSAKEEEYRKEGSALYLQNVKTLVLEKTAANLNIMDSYLRAFGISCELTTSPAAAVSLLETANVLSSKPFDLFILDYDTPNNNAFDFVRILRENPKIPKFPKIIVLLPTLRTDLFDKLEENGIDIGIGKPVIPSVLHNGIMEIFAHKAYAAGQTFGEASANGVEPEKVHLTILVVDDNSTNQLIAKLLLEQAGFEVFLAGDGAEGIEQFLKNRVKIAAILMDLHMPVKNGYEAADEIRKLDPNIPIIALTAEVIPGIQEKCEAHGMHFYISKPFDPEHFVQTIRNILKDSIPPAETASTVLHREKGIKNLGDNATLYEMVLREYFNENQETARKLALAVAEKRFEDARQIVHKVKGSSGTIGADELYAVAVDLQKALDAKEEEVIIPKTAEFVGYLRQVLAEIGEKTPESLHQ